MKRILLALVMIYSYCSANYVVDDEINLSSFISVSNPSIEEARQLKNGHLLITVGGYPNSQIIILNQSNELVFSDILQDKENELSGHPTRNQFVIGGYDFNDGTSVAILYTYNELINTYESINLSGEILNYDLHEFDNDNNIYVCSGNMLTIYRNNGSDSNITISSHQSAGFNQDNFVLNWDSSSGAQYQIQSSTDLTNWVDVGSALIGTGDMMTWANHVTNSQAFYRVVEE